MARPGPDKVPFRSRGARRRSLAHRSAISEVTLDLAPVRAALKDKWEKVAPSVRRYASLVIERRLGEGGSYEQDGDTFVIRMAGTSLGAAHRALGRIEREFYERIFGSRDEVDRVLSRYRATAPRRKGPGFLAAWTDRLKRMFAGAAREPRDAPPSPARAPANGQGETPAGESVASETRAARSPASPDSPAAATGHTPVREGSPAGGSTGGCSPEPAPAAESDRKPRANALERALYQAALEAERQDDSASQKRVFPAPGTLFIYRGLWLVAQEAIPALACVPARALSPFEFATGEAIIPAGAGAPQLTVLDDMVLEKIVHDLSSHEPDRIRNTIWVPVHYESLAGDTGAHYQKALKTVPPALHDKITIEIINLSQGTGQRIAHSIIRGLRPYCRDVVGRLNLSDHNFQAWRGLELKAFGVDIESDGRPEAKIIADLDIFVATAARHGYGTYVRGARSRSLAASIATNRVQYLDGPAIDEGDLAFAADPLPFAIADLYADL